MKGEKDSFQLVPSDVTGGNGDKIKQVKFNLNMRKYPLTMSVVKQCSRLLREVVESLSL